MSQRDDTSFKQRRPQDTLRENLQVDGMKPHCLR